MGRRFNEFKTRFRKHREETREAYRCMVDPLVDPFGLLIVNAGRPLCYVGDLLKSIRDAYYV